MQKKNLCNLKPQAKRSQHFNATYRSIVGCNMLRAFGHFVATHWDKLGVVGSNLKMVKFFMPHLWMLYDVVVVWPGRPTMLRLSMRASSIFNSQHPAMLRYVSFKCCDCLPEACKCWANNVAICCVDILRSFGRGSRYWANDFTDKTQGVYLY